MPAEMYVRSCSTYIIIYMHSNMYFTYIRSYTFTDLSKTDTLALAAVAAVATVGHVVGDGAARRRTTATLGL